MLSFLKRIPYWYLIVLPVTLIALGALSNQAVLFANDGRFPVQLNQANVSRFTDGDVKPAEDGIIYLDDIHTVMRPEDHLKFLADIINVRTDIMSVGDLALDAGSGGYEYGSMAWIVLVIRKMIAENGIK